MLTTIAPDGRPNSVPVCFVLIADVLYSPLDEKPKRSADPRALRRVRNLAADPRASVLVDGWDEDWSRLWFVDLAVNGTLLEPGTDEHGRACAALRAKYPQYRDHRLEERPMLRLEPVDVNGRWSARDTEPALRTS